MRTAKGVSRAPYVGMVQPRVCECKCDPKELFTARTEARAIAMISGYWNIYVTFYGTQTFWLEFIVVDVQDGRIVWKNGQPTKEGASNGAGGEDSLGPAAVGKERAGQWLIAGGSAFRN